MNPELQTQLTTLLRSLSEGVLWAGAQIPPLVQEKILLGRIEGTFAMIIGGVLIVTAVWCANRLRRVENDDDVVLVLILGGVASLVGFAIVGVNFHNFATAIFAPRLYVVEWLRELLGK